MINIANPLNETENLVFEREEQLNDWLMKEFNKAVNDLNEATNRKGILVGLLNEQCTSTKTTGTVKVRGDVYEASIVRGVTPKYDVLDKEATPILQDLYTQVEEAREFIRLKFEEKTAGMAEWIDQCTNNNMNDFTDEEKEVIQKFITCRRLQANSPQIKITQIAEPNGGVITNI